MEKKIRVLCISDIKLLSIIYFACLHTQSERWLSREDKELLQEVKHLIEEVMF